MLLRMWKRMGWVVVAGVVGCGGATNPDDGHDVVELQIGIADGQPGDLFAGTARVEASLDYGDCLRGFYRTEGATYVIDGPVGIDIFRDWETRLCGADAPEAAAPCEGVTITQDVEHLGVDYDVERIAENHQLAFGPVPGEALAGCAPVMQVDGEHTLTGFDVNGEPLWITASWQPAEAASGDRQAIRISAAAAN